MKLSPRLILVLCAVFTLLAIILLSSSSDVHHEVLHYNNDNEERHSRHHQHHQISNDNNNVEQRHQKTKKKKSIIIQKQEDNANNEPEETEQQQNNIDEVDAAVIPSSISSSSTSSSFPKPRYQEAFGAVTSSANSAPFLPHLNIRQQEQQAQSSSNIIKNEDIACWDRLGNPQKQIPNWMSSFFGEFSSSSTDTTYLDLFNATEEQPHAALIGWIPSKFMGPQPNGVKANGLIMIPPTKGRNYETYLREYNASWHVRFGGGNGNSKDQQHPYVFQLGHRNAIAVCIRERIHLHVRRCTPKYGKLPPILIHSCLCRKCEEKFVPGYFSSSSSSSSNTKTKNNNNNNKLTPQILRQPKKNNVFVVERGSSASLLASSFAEFIFLPSWKFFEPPIQILLSKAIRENSNSNHNEKNKNNKQTMILPSSNNNNQQRNCLSVLAAPWLIPTSIFPRFEYEGKENDLDALLKVQADFRQHVIVVIFNAAWVDHLYNWIYSAVNNAQITSFIVATMDKESLELCKQLRLPCFDAVDYAVFEDDPTLKSSAHTRKVSEAMSWIKPRLATAIIGRGYGFWMIDLDMSWNSNPMKHMLQQQQQSGSQLLHQCDSPARFSINSGFYDAKATLMMYLFFMDTMTFVPDENSDQTAMRLFGRYDHTFALFNECLNKWVFDMKCNYKIANTVKRVKQKQPDDSVKQVETFEWNNLERDRSKFKWVILHATCLSGAMSKIIWLRTMNAWFLDDLEEWRRKAVDIDTNHNNNGDEKICLVDPTSQQQQKLLLLDKKKGSSSLIREIKFSKKYPKGITDEKYLEKRH